ncbi:MAG: ABC transporter ATP-binding protein [Archaeoglobaceae archaeon]|nr:ABC transporter ATP-binding protein [Archaeoglobaceae archaeon]MCX8151574.1 ABC transporter ATP-binding protein [Archaeoglobaceae archaeon]MDW8013148.1 ABC transporter ATP-binding protein [Archaeoglobaceae archaeon]
MLRVEKLNSGYKELHILFDVDARIDSNTITAILGPNGSGKSTLLKSIFGLANIFSGKIYLNGKEITFTSPHEKAKLGLVYLPQTENVFTNLTVKENLNIAAYTLKDDARDRIELALNIFPELSNFLKRKAGTLSGGERQMLAMAMAIIRKAEVLMLDEPTAQLSPKFVDMIVKKIVELRDEHKMTILLVEQNAKKALEISEKVYILVSGRVAFEGSAQELLGSGKFEKLCLGLVE